MIDYSKLSEAELEAIANNDYSKLSNKTLRQLSNEPEPSAFAKFKEPFETVSIKDWSEKSLLAPMLQTMRAVTPFGLLRPDLAAQDLKAGSQNLVGKGKQMAQGAYQIATNPVESAQKAYTAVTENPAGVAGEMVKGMLYDPEMLIGSGLGNVAESAVKSTVQSAKTLGNVAEGAVNTLGRKGTQPGERATYAGQYESARQPAGNVYHTPENIQAWRSGQIDTAELNSRAMPYTAEQATALKRTGGMVPYSGQVARATGEALAEPYTRLSGYIPDLATAAIGYGLLGPAGAIAAPALNLARKGVGLYNAGKTAGGMRQLGDLGFEPLFTQETKALQAGRPHPSVIPTPSGPVSPQQLAAGKINPAMATTPAAQAAVATTQAKAPMPTAATAPMAIPEPQVQPVVQPKPTLQETIAKFKTPAEMRRALYTTVPNDKLEALIKQRFPPETPAVKPAVVETPEAAAVRTADDAMREFMDEQRGIVKGDIPATRQNFMNNVAEAKQSLMAAREENKAKFADRASVMNPNAGQGSRLPNPKDNIDDKAVVRHMIKQTGNISVNQKNKKITVNKQAYNDLARQMGVDLDWTTAPNINGMGIADARKAINKWTYDSIDKQFPELGLKARQESMSSQQRRAEKELGLTNNTPAPQPAVPINSALQAALAKSRGNKPSGTMEMITNEPAAIKKIQDAPWLSPDEFNQEVFMKELGKGSDKEFIAKMRSPDGDVIRAVDKELDSEMFKYPDGSGFLVRKYNEVPGAADYTIYDTSGTRYEITKFEDGIRRIELLKKDEMVAEYVRPSGSDKGFWAVIDRNAEGGGQMIYKADLKFSKNPNTRRLHKELPKIDFNSVVQEQLARAQEVKGK